MLGSWSPGGVESDHGGVDKEPKLSSTRASLEAIVSNDDNTSDWNAAMASWRLKLRTGHDEIMRGDANAVLQETPCEEAMYAVQKLCGLRLNYA